MNLASLISAPVQAAFAVADAGLAVTSKALETGRAVLSGLPEIQTTDAQGAGPGTRLVSAVESVLVLAGPRSPLYSASKIAALIADDKPLGKALRPGGPVDRLMQPGGLADRLTEPDGVLERLFAPGGAVDRITAPGGLLERALTEGGLVDQLLAEDGVLERLMSEDGVIDKITATDGPLEQLAGLSEVLAKATPSLNALTPTVELLGDTVSALTSVMNPITGLLPRRRPRPAAGPQLVPSERVTDESAGGRGIRPAGRP